MMFRALPVRVVATQNGPTYRIANNLVTFKARAADTNGAYSLFETTTDPGESIPLHRQRFEDEAFWVLDGTYTFQLDTRQVTLGPGDYAYVPRGMLHCFTNSGDTPARMLVLVTPGGIHERFLAELGESIANPCLGARRGTACDDTHLQQIAHKYGIDILMQDTVPRTLPGHAPDSSTRAATAADRAGRFHTADVVRGAPLVTRIRRRWRQR